MTTGDATAPDSPAGEPAARRKGGVLRQSRQVLVGFLGSQAIAVVTAPLVARSLSVSDRGRLGLLTSLAGLLSLLTTLGIPGGLLYYSSRNQGQPPTSRLVLRRLVLLQMALSVVVGLGIVLPVCGHDSGLVAGLLGAAVVAPMNYTTTAHWLLLGFDRKAEYQRFLLLSSSIWLVAVVGLSVSHVHSLVAFAAAWLVFNSVPALYGWWLLHGPSGPWTTSHEHSDVPTGDIVRFGLKALVGLVPLSEVASTEIVIASVVLNPVQRGLFVVATNFREPGRLLGGALATYAAPAHARLAGEDQAEHARRVVRLSVIAGILTAIVIGVLAPTVMTVAFGEKYRSAGNAARLLAAAGGIGLVGRAVRGLRFGEGRAGLTSLSEIGSLTVLVGAFLLPVHWTLFRFVVVVFVAEVVRALFVMLAPIIRRGAPRSDDDGTVMPELPDADLPPRPAPDS